MSGEFDRIYNQSIEQPEEFWAEVGSALHWDKVPTRVLDDSDSPFNLWYPDGELNACYNALDLHVDAGNGDRLALIHDSPVTDSVTRYTFREMRDAVAQLAGVLVARGVSAGDRVIIYMPMIPEAAMAMLACARIGAIHSVVFGGFAANELAPLYILYTSGTTGQPKGVVRDTAGYLAALKWSMSNLYGVKPGEVYWAASDVGWVVGHSYIVYGPLANGNTTVMYEGKPVGTPDPGAFWRVISEHKVACLFTAPTAFRAIKKEDPDATHLARYDLSNFRTLFLAGERCDPDTLHWAEDHLKVPVIDHWWQTETGWAIAANCIGIEHLPVVAGSPTRPVPGYRLDVLDTEGQPVPRGEIGALAVKSPLPPGSFLTLWNAKERFVSAYFDTFPGYYETGDAGYIDDNGYVFVMSRTDDVINVAGHRLSTGQMEEVLAEHPDVAECAVLGVEDSLKGQLPLGLLVLSSNSARDHGDIVAECVQQVRDTIGPVAAFKLAVVVNRLPKTRSGKILRGTVRAIADGRDWKMPATIDDPAILDEITDALATLGYPNAS